MEIIGLPDIPNPTVPRFQMFVTGELSQTFLLDTETGVMWHMIVERRQSPGGPDQAVGVWRPITE